MCIVKKTLMHKMTSGDDGDNDKRIKNNLKIDACNLTNKQLFGLYNKQCLYVMLQRLRDQCGTGCFGCSTESSVKGG